MDDTTARVLAALLAMQRRSWEQGVLSHAALDLGLGDVAARVARDAVALQDDDGRLGTVDDAGLVNCGALLEVVLHEADRTGDASLTAAARRQVDWLAEGCPRTDDGTLLHLDGSREVWVDTVYMAVPALAAAGRTDLALAQLDGHRDRLHDPSTGLYGHRHDDATGTATRAAPWATGNGWAVAGVARAIRRSGTDPALLVWGAHARGVVDRVLALRAPSGLLHDVLDDPATFEDVTSVQLVAYACYLGVGDGWLPDRYGHVADDLLTTARAHVDADGFLRPACGAPRFDREGTSAEAQATHLLAVAASRGR